MNVEVDGDREMVGHAQLPQEGVILVNDRSQRYIFISPHHHPALDRLRHVLVNEAETFLFVFVAVLVLGCGGLTLMRTRAPDTFRVLTVGLVWLLPGLSVASNWFTVLWGVFSFITVWIFTLLRKNPLAKRTPRTVYTWYNFVYQVCNVGAGLGLVVMLLLSGSLGFSLVMISLYFGILGREFAILSVMRIASRLGYNRGAGDSEMPARQVARGICAICDDELPSLGMPSDADNSDGGGGELPSFCDTGNDVVVIGCHHAFHKFCIRGWAMVGKRDTCAVCNERVDLQNLFPQAWQKGGLAWGKLLDNLMCCLTFPPIICIVSLMAAAHLASFFYVDQIIDALGAAQKEQMQEQAIFFYQPPPKMPEVHILEQ